MGGRDEDNTYELSNFAASCSFRNPLHQPVSLLEGITTYFIYVKNHFLRDIHSFIPVVMQEVKPEDLNCSFR